ncbi:MAG: diguanylate cyclase [Caldimicrobium sp.]
MLSLLQVPVKNFLNIHHRKVLLVSPEVSFKELIELLKKHEENFAIVHKEGKPIGIITERDIVRAYLYNYPLDKPVYPLVKKELVKINSSSSLLVAFNLMTENYIRRLVVVNEKGEFEGVLTQQELILYSSEELFQGVGRIRDLLDMKSELVFALSEETVKEAVEKMVKYNIGALPILDEEGKPIGIITEKDLINICESDLKKPLREVALKKVITIKASDYLSNGIRLFKKYKIRHLVVVDESGRAINLISQRDFIQSLACTYIEFIQSQLNQAKNFLSLIPEIVIELSECDSECKLTWMNDFAKKNLGDEYLEKDILTFIDYDTWNRIYGILKREKFLYKEKIKSLIGKVYEITGTYLDLGKEGKIKLFLREITSELLKEEDLERELRFFKKFLDNSLDYILVIDKEGKIVFSNATFKKSLGFSEEEISNKTIFEIVNLPQSELMRNIDYLIKKGVEIKGRRYYKDAYQNLIPVEIKAKATYINGEPYIIINARDIREIIQLESKHQKELERLISFYNFVNKLNLLQNEGDLWKTLENYLLEKVDIFHYYEINPQNTEIWATYISGDKRSWIDCLEKEASSCQVFRTGKNFLGVGDIKCPMLKKVDDYDHFCFPLFFEGKLFGIVTLLKKDKFDENELKFFEDTLQTFNIYLNQIRLLRHLKDLAIKDPLLNIYNRRFLMEVLRKEEEKAKREGGFFSLILLDVDHFKKINDTYGHSVGDKVLKEVSLLLSLNIREMDYLARWGGEEFLFFLPKTSKEEAVAIAERLRSKIESYEFYLDERTKLKITASFGVAEFPRDGLSVDNLLKKADERLYKAKALGRNRVCSN